MEMWNNQFDVQKSAVLGREMWSAAINLGVISKHQFYICKITKEMSGERGG